MLPINFNNDSSALKAILLLGAHCDDIEIGCGASVLRLVKAYPEAHFYWVVFSSNAARKQEAQRSAEAFLSGARNKTILIKGFRNGYFPYIGAEIKDYFEELKKTIEPQLIFTHFRDDLHQDHNTLSKLTWNTFRNHLILEYEIAKYDGDLGVPNFFIPASVENCEKKIENLLTYFATQTDKQWFSADTFKGLMRLRGVECNAPEHYAEAFYCRKMCY